MTPTVVGIGVALAGAVVVWLVASIQRRPVTEDVDRMLAEAESEAAAIVAAAEAKAAQIVAAAETAIGEARETAGRAAAEIRSDAKRSGRRIIKEAEARGLELVETAEIQRVQAERAAVCAQEFADQSLGEFTEFVQALLTRVDREFVTSASNGGAPAESEGVPRSNRASPPREHGSAQRSAG